MKILLKTTVCLLVIGSLLGLVGCSATSKRSVLPQPAPDVSVAVEKPWRAKGRFAVKQGDKGGNASFIWQQTGEHYQMQLHGPFGAGNVIITGSSHHVTAREANGKQHQASSPEQLMKKLVGWQVPLSGLRYWIQGIPVPQTRVTSQRRDPQGRLRSLVQNGWTIQYNSYHALPHQVNLPKAIQLHNPQLKIKLVVTQWN